MDITNPNDTKLRQWEAAHVVIWDDDGVGFYIKPVLDESNLIAKLDRQYVYVVDMDKFEHVNDGIDWIFVKYEGQEGYIPLRGGPENKLWSTYTRMTPSGNIAGLGTALEPCSLLVINETIQIHTGPSIHDQVVEMIGPGMYQGFAARLRYQDNNGHVWVEVSIPGINGTRDETPWHGYISEQLVTRSGKVVPYVKIMYRKPNGND